MKIVPDVYVTGNIIYVYSNTVLNVLPNMSVEILTYQILILFLFKTQGRSAHTTMV
jgi:hypothetical protein